MVSFHYQDLEIAAQFGLGQVSLSQIRLGSAASY